MRETGRLDAETLEPLAADLEVSVARLLSAASFYHYFSLPASDELRCEGPVCQLNGHRNRSGYPDQGIACPGLCDQVPASLRNGEYRANGGKPTYLVPVLNQSDPGLAIFDGWATDGTEGIDDYRRFGGYAALETLLNGTDDESALDVLEASVLEGRGGVE